MDAVLTFEDIEQWRPGKRVLCPAECEDASFLNASSKILRMYPVTSGILESLKARGDCNNYRMITVDGIQGVHRSVFFYGERRAGPLLCGEVNACKGG
ncbi:MAG: hypothetical protein ACLVHV_15665 [Oscillospiraceae bacterium]